MKKICDVQPITYYAVHVIPESRLYTFRRHYKGEPINSFYVTQSTPRLNSSDYNLKIFESIVMDIHNLAGYLSAATLPMSNMAKQYFTFNMSIFKNGCSYSMFTSEFLSWAETIEVPVFTSAERAQEFLVDELRILHMENSYLEFEYNGRTSREPAELEIVSLTQDEVLQLSHVKTIVVNTYVPAFF